MPDIDYHLWCTWLQAVQILFRENRPNEAEEPIPFGLAVLSFLAGNHTTHTDAVWASLEELRTGKTAKEIVH